MANFYPSLNADLRAFIAEQHIFFTASATADGRINLSPKGMESFLCLDDQTAAYLNVTGSGNETAAHLSADGRLTVMFCSVTTRPLILRLYGAGRAIHPHDAEWEAYLAHFDPIPGARQIIVLAIESVQTSCGFAVPFYDYAGERDTLRKWAAQKGPEGIRQYWEERNSRSIDGLATGILDGIDHAHS
ncbi:MAG: pyridoxamine 5'-phosphate oxidase family protein [Caldilineaceae bacterium]|nr:pyridoxamine 5'-phosphate oxidase family protein [Caldilineaceae bacterium]